MTQASKLKWAAFIVIDLALALSLVFLFMARNEANRLEQLAELGTNMLPRARAIRPFSLEDSRGQAFTEQQLTDRWSLLFFGFTNCPDVCPMTMAELGKFYRQLETQNNTIETPQIIMVTVDPQRDSASELASYLGDFHDDFVGLTGTDRQLARLAEQLFVVSNEAAAHARGHDNTALPRASDGELLFDHSGHISVINPAGELYAVMRLPHRDQNLLQAYESLTSNWP